VGRQHSLPAGSGRIEEPLVLHVTLVGVPSWIWC